MSNLKEKRKKQIYHEPRRREKYYRKSYKNTRGDGVLDMEETGGGGKKSLDLYIFVICSPAIFPDKWVLGMKEREEMTGGFGG